MGTPFESTPRKIVLPFIALTALGWLQVVIGFGILTTKEDVDKGHPNTYPLWMVSLCGPFLFGCAIAHAAFWRKPASAIIGAITAFLSVLFLTALGMNMFNFGQYIRLLEDEFEDVPNSIALMFAGSFLATLFWTPVTILWHFYDLKFQQE